MQKIGEEVCIDTTFAREVDAKDANGNPLPPQVFYRVYTWEPREDAANRIPEDQMHWALDSEHETWEAALDTANAINAGLDASTKPRKAKK